MATRDLVMIGIGFGIGVLFLTSLGRKSLMTAAGMGKAEIERALAKAEKKSKKRAKPYG